MTHYTVAFSKDTSVDQITVSDQFKNATSFQIVCNDLKDFPTKNLIKILQALPKDLQFLDLSKSNFDQFSIEDLVKIFKALPENLHTLDLSWNFEKLSPSNWIAAFSALPDKLKKVIINEQPNNDFTPDEWIKIISALPPNLEFFNLNWINFDKFDVNQLIILLKVLPKNLNSLDLSGHKFNKFTTGDWIELIKSLPKLLNSITLSRNDFDSQISDIELINVLMTTPISLNTIKMDYRTINPNDLRINKLNEELLRLKNSSKEVSDLWIYIGLIEASNDKIDALQKLVCIFEKTKTSNIDPSIISSELTEWKKMQYDTIKKQRNKIHAFFSPQHISTAQKIVDEILTPLLQPIARQTSQVELQLIPESKVSQQTFS